MRKLILSLLIAVTLIASEAKAGLVRSAIDLATQVYGVLSEVNGGTGQSTYATGDILYASGANTLDKLPLGNDGEILTVDSGNVSWQPGAPGGGITDLNGETGATQTFATGTTGTDFNINSAANTHTFNIPDASGTNRGLVTTGAQTIAGVKTFSSAPNFDSVTASRPLKVDGSKNVTSALIDLSSANDVTGTLPTGNGGTGLSSIGGANTVLGVNNAANALEYKAFATGTTGTDFNIAHSANTVTFNLPDASASNRGAVTTGAQTFAGVKTFNSAPLLNSLTASRPLKLDASKNVTSALIDLSSASDVTGTLPIANGGTALTSLNWADISSGVTVTSSAGTVTASTITAVRGLKVGRTMRVSFNFNSNLTVASADYLILNLNNAAFNGFAGTGQYVPVLIQSSGTFSIGTALIPSNSSSIRIYGGTLASNFFLTTASQNHGAFGTFIYETNS